jgi:hypothetical protein
MAELDPPRVQRHTATVVVHGHKIAVDYLGGKHPVAFQDEVCLSLDK